MFRCVSSLERLAHMYTQTHRFGLCTDVAAKYKMRKNKASVFLHSGTRNKKFTVFGARECAVPAHDFPQVGKY